MAPALTPWRELDLVPEEASFTIGCLHELTVALTRVVSLACCVISVFILHQWISTSRLPLNVHRLPHLTQVVGRGSPADGPIVLAELLVERLIPLPLHEVGTGVLVYPDGFLDGTLRHVALNYN